MSQVWVEILGGLVLFLAGLIAVLSTYDARKEVSGSKDGKPYKTKPLTNAGKLRVAAVILSSLAGIGAYIYQTRLAEEAELADIERRLQEQSTVLHQIQRNLVPLPDEVLVTVQLRMTSKHQAFLKFTQKAEAGTSLFQTDYDSLTFAKQLRELFFSLKVNKSTEDNEWDEIAWFRSDLIDTERWKDNTQASLERVDSETVLLTLYNCPAREMAISGSFLSLEDFKGQQVTLELAINNWADTTTTNLFQMLPLNVEVEHISVKALNGPSLNVEIENTSTVFPGWRRIRGVFSTDFARQLTLR